MWRLLTGRLGWSLRRPERRAVERDESEIARWIAHEWPRIKKGAVNTRAWIVFLDESGVSLLPQIRRTYAPRGRTPLLRHRTWDLSVDSTVCRAHQHAVGARNQGDLQK
ncbi:winged helix-turn-helix domain-containing protein, partial [Streptomyces sp. NPDC086077]|uniref:winged helix-turn-helix domain-containing protein n=1 Tax=Streptomyces sp. NPDC086077 TaxID=3154862 RepID=UPI003448ABC3